MNNNQTNQQYVNGIFIEEKEGPYGKFLSIGITEEGLREIQNLSKSPKGWRNLTGSRQKDNPNKYSVKPYQSTKQIVENSGKKLVEPPVPNTDDLPF